MCGPQPASCCFLPYRVLEVLTKLQLAPGLPAPSSPVSPFCLFELLGCDLGVLPALAAGLLPSWQALCLEAPSGSCIFRTSTCLEQPQRSSLREKCSPRMAGLLEGEEGEKGSLPRVCWS